MTPITKGEIKMKPVIAAVTVATLIVSLMYWGLAAVVFQFRNPKANPACSITSFLDVIKVKKLDTFQK